MLSTLITAPAALALDWDDEVKGHLRVDSDDEKARVEDILIPAATEHIQAISGRQLITATWATRYSSFRDACCAATRMPWKYPGATILLPHSPLQTVTWIKYYDSQNVQQTLNASLYAVTVIAGPKSSPGYIRMVDPDVFPSTFPRPDAVEIKYVAGYGAASTTIPGELRQAMLLIVGELFERREIAVQGTIIQQVPFGVDAMAVGYLADV